MFINPTTHEHLAADKIRTYRWEADDYRAARTSVRLTSRARPRQGWLQLLRARARSVVPLTSP